jgi:hypothetical protein
MMWLFFLGWLAGIVSTLGFGKWYSERHKMEIDDETARMIMACLADEEKDKDDERTGQDP